MAKALEIAKFNLWLVKEYSVVDPYEKKKVMYFQVGPVKMWCHSKLVWELDGRVPSTFPVSVFSGLGGILSR